MYDFALNELVRIEQYSSHARAIAIVGLSATVFLLPEKKPKAYCFGQQKNTKPQCILFVFSPIYRVIVDRNKNKSQKHLPSGRGRNLLLESPYGSKEGQRTLN